MNSEGILLWECHDVRGDKSQHEKVCYLILLAADFVLLYKRNVTNDAHDVTDKAS